MKKWFAKLRYRLVCWLEGDWLQNIAENWSRDHDRILAGVERQRRNAMDVIEEWENGFSCIAFYNGYEEWLWDLADELDACEEPIFSVPTDLEWFTDKHALWMMLVALFGDWGTSIRSGWIERPKEAAEFINRVTDRRSREEEESK